MSDLFCPRQIIFTIPGKTGVQVTATENDGKIDFIVDALGTNDLRGLFFHLKDESKLAGLQVTGGDGLITGSQLKANGVIDLLDNVNMNGKAKPFDFGIKFGTPGVGQDLLDDPPIHFTLSNTAGLTLDDLAHVQFGARLDGSGDKIVTIAPAAPDAVDDEFKTNLFEDGAAGLGSPSKTPTVIVLDVLKNDTDADPGQQGQFIITGLHDDPLDGPMHGTVAIGPDGKTILYTPKLDFSGTDSFEYCISDGNGGQDHAVVTLELAAVADLPTFDVQVLQGANINEIILNVTARQNDADFSEFIDRIDAAIAGIDFNDVTVAPLGGINPGNEPDEIIQQFKVTLPPNEGSEFDLKLTAFSKETSNGDEEQATFAVPIEVDFTHNTTQQTFSTENKSIWDPSLPGGFKDDRFVGIDVSDDASLDIGVASAGGDYSLKLGFQSTLDVTLGHINATLPYNITIDTTYNVTTDSLLINPSAFLDPSANFTTVGAGGSYNLDFVFEAMLHAFFHNPIDDFDERVTLDLGFNLLNIDSATFTKEIDIPPLNPVATLTLRWPQVDTTGAPSGPTTLHSDGESQDTVNLDVDVIALALAALGISPNPLDLGFVNLVSLNVNGGVDMRQHFDLNALLDASLTLEDGFDIPFEFGSPSSIIPNLVKNHDQDGNGTVEFDLHLELDATLRNQTGIGFGVGGDISLLEFPDPFGALVTLGADLDLGEIGIYDSKNFPLVGFNSQDYGFSVVPD
jgi:hypothetical protein